MMYNTFRVPYGSQYIYGCAEGWPSDVLAILKQDDPIWNRPEVEYLPNLCWTVDPTQTHCRVYPISKYHGQRISAVFWADPER